MRALFLLAVFCLAIVSPLHSSSAQATLRDTVAYEVGVGDILNVSVYRAPDYSTVVEVGADGTIALGMLGKVAVAGMSATEISDTVANRLRADGIFRDPVVNVLVQTYRSATVSVLGNVAKPGEYPLDRGDITASDILARSGADLGIGGGTIELVRANGEKRSIPTEAILSGRTSIPLAARDTLIVNQPEKFFISGEVNRSGAFAIEPGLTFGRALALAGGVTARGSRNRIKVTRTTNGEERTIKVSSDDVVQPNDLIVIGARIF